jgi:hypothetical protein
MQYQKWITANTLKQYSQAVEAQFNHKINNPNHKQSIL